MRKYCRIKESAADSKGKDIGTKDGSVDPDEKKPDVKDDDDCCEDKGDKESPKGSDAGDNNRDDDAVCMSVVKKNECKEEEKCKESYLCPVCE